MHLHRDSCRSATGRVHAPVWTLRVPPIDSIHKPKSCESLENLSDSALTPSQAIPLPPSPPMHSYSLLCTPIHITSTDAPPSQIALDLPDQNPYIAPMTVFPNLPPILSTLLRVCSRVGQRISGSAPQPVSTGFPFDRLQPSRPSQTSQIHPRRSNTARKHARFERLTPNPPPADA